MVGWALHARFTLFMQVQSCQACPQESPCWHDSSSEGSEDHTNELRQRPPGGKTHQGQASHWPIRNPSKGQRNSEEIGCYIFEDTEAKGPFVYLWDPHGASDSRLQLGWLVPHTGLGRECFRFVVTLR